MEDRELTFWEHLDVLRWALARIVATLSSMRSYERSVRCST